MEAVVKAFAFLGGLGVGFVLGLALWGWMEWKFPPPPAAPRYAPEGRAVT